MDMIKLISVNNDELKKWSIEYLSKKWLLF